MPLACAAYEHPGCTEGRDPTNHALKAAPTLECARAKSTELTSSSRFSSAVGVPVDPSFEPLQSQRCSWRVS
eukprot:5474431-Pleurochrysis_carterae.AAC.2